MAETKELLNKTETENLRPETRVKPEMVDVAPRTHVPENIKSWLEKIEEDPGMANPISDHQGKTIMSGVAPQNPKIILPISRNTFLGGFKKSINDASRWLSTFLLRLIKMKKGNVKFKEE